MLLCLSSSKDARWVRPGRADIGCAPVDSKWRKAQGRPSFVSVSACLSPPHHHKEIPSQAKPTCKAVNMVLDEQICSVTAIAILALALADIPRAAASPNEASPGNVEGHQPLLIYAWAQSGQKLRRHEAAEWHLGVLCRIAAAAASGDGGARCNRRVKPTGQLAPLARQATAAIRTASDTSTI